MVAACLAVPAQQLTDGSVPQAPVGAMLLGEDTKCGPW